MKLTEYESLFLNKMAESDFAGDGEGVCDYIVIPEYESAMGIKMDKIRGVMASLVKKNLIDVTYISREEDGFGWNWVAVNTDYCKINMECSEKYECQVWDAEFVNLEFYTEVK